MFLNARLCARISELEQLLAAVGTVRQRIGYFLEPLDCIFAALRAENKIFSACEATDFASGWQNAVLYDTKALKKEEREVIARFGATLGKTDRDGQLALCDAMREKLCQYKKQASADKDKSSGPVTVLPFFAGLTVVLLLL